jgi:hypothetical protein
MNKTTPLQSPQATVILQDEGLRKLKGFVQIPKAILLHTQLSYGAKVAYGILLSYAWQEDFCFPAQHALADDLGCSVRQAQRLLEELKANQLIDWKQIGLNKPNVYSILAIPFPKKNAKIGKSNAGIPANENRAKNKDTTNMSYPDTTYLSYQDATNMSYKEYSGNNNQKTVNVNGSLKKDAKSVEHARAPDKTDLRKLPDLKQPKEQTQLITEEILQALGDTHSQAFYYLVAAKIPASIIHKTLSEIKQDGARRPEKVFAYRMKCCAEERLSATERERGITPMAALLHSSKFHTLPAASVTQANPPDTFR